MRAGPNKNPKVSVRDEPVHYRLRPIKEVQFGFAHFMSHFIRVQIFQIDFPLILSASKFFRYFPLSFHIVGDKMNSPFILKFNAIKRFLMTEQEKETS